MINRLTHEISDTPRGAGEHRGDNKSQVSQRLGHAPDYRDQVS